MTLLSSFKAVHYRGIDGLSLPRLTRANLVTGVNGIGKTALLEAMWLFTGAIQSSVVVGCACTTVGRTRSGSCRPVGGAVEAAPTPRAPSTAPYRCRRVAEGVGATRGRERFAPRAKEHLRESGGDCPSRETPGTMPESEHVAQLPDHRTHTHLSRWQTCRGKD